MEIAQDRVRVELTGGEFCRGWMNLSHDKIFPLEEKLRRRSREETDALALVISIQGTTPVKSPAGPIFVLSHHVNFMEATRSRQGSILVSG